MRNRKIKNIKIDTDIKRDIAKVLLQNNFCEIDKIIKSHKDYGKIISDDTGKLKCHICGKYYRGLSAHIWQAHNIQLREYKYLFGLTQNKALISDDIKETKRLYITGEVKDKLLRDGLKTRFKNK